MSSSSMAKVGASKAQLSLYKIIAVISTVPPPPHHHHHHHPNLKEDEDLDAVVDLSLRLGPVPSPAAEGKSSDAECDPKADVSSGGGKEESEIIDQGGGGDEGGYLDVLLEAVRRVTEEEEEEEEEERRDDKRKVNTDVEAPAVRSKRGRNRSLPSRYRDSVIEPWGKLPTVHRRGRSRMTSRP